MVTDGGLGQAYLMDILWWGITVAERCSSPQGSANGLASFAGINKVCYRLQGVGAACHCNGRAQQTYKQADERVRRDER
jgi:hypothetical protein